MAAQKAITTSKRQEGTENFHRVIGIGDVSGACIRCPEVEREVIDDHRDCERDQQNVLLGALLIGAIKPRCST